MEWEIAVFKLIMFACLGSLAVICMGATVWALKKMFKR